MAVRKVFLSYSRRNTEEASRLKAELTAHGYDVWMDQSSIELGKTWDEEIKKAIRETDCVLALQSVDASESENIKDELVYAIGRKKLIIPVLLEDCELPLFISRRQYICLYPNYDEQLQKLVKLLATGRLDENENARGRINRKQSLVISLLVVLLASGAVTYYFLTRKEQAPDSKQAAMRIQLVTLTKKEGFRYSIGDYFKSLDSLPDELRVTPDAFLANFYQAPIDTARNKELLEISETGDTIKVSIRSNKMSAIDGIKVLFDTAFFNQSPFIDLNGSSWFDLGVSTTGRQEILYKKGAPEPATLLLFNTHQHE